MRSLLYKTQDDWGPILEKLHLRGVLDKAWRAFYEWVRDDLLERDTLYELAILALVLLATLYLTRRGRDRLRRRWAAELARGGKRAQWRAEFVHLLGPVISLAFLWPLYLATRLAGLDNDLINLLVHVIAAWVVIRLVTSALFKPFWARLFAVLIWLVAALNIFGLLEPTLAFLDGVKFSAGRLQISLLSLLESLFFFTVLLRLGVRAGAYLEERLAASGELEPSTRSLIGILAKTVIVIVVGIISLELIGVKMDMLTFFSGALGFGLGIGLRAVFSNLICGIILMVDKSIKPGDVIQVGEIFGRVTALKARFASVVTRDGREYLIPNEDLVSRQVINCSYSDRAVRLKVPITIAYGSDVDQAMALAEEAAAPVKRVCAQPPPASRLMGLGDSAINLELRFWISDPENGVANVTSEVLQRVLALYAQHGVEIPFPQRDLRIKQMPDKLS
ncbi:MAG: mechanosensitive ion channel family protein [Desulfarculus sp.]|nr:MAG: mechanosensitive ion channel family protein [Desulfarculus sp.]